jgi:hypothetical protein
MPFEEIKPAVQSMSAVKLSDSKIEITTQPDPIVRTYDYDFLVQQRVGIISQANNYIDNMQKQVDDIDAKIALCDEQGVSSAVMPDKLI